MKSSKEVYTDEDKKEAVIDWVIRDKSVKEIADDYGVTSPTVYNWKEQLLDDERECKMKKDKQVCKLNDKVKLNQEIEELKKEIYRLQLEKDILENATLIIKKDRGINLNELTNKEKVLLIDALKDRYSLKELLNILKIAKSSYFYHEKILKHDDNYHQLHSKIKNVFNNNYHSYGYRRIHAQLKKDGINICEKVVRRIMKEGLIVVTVRKKKYSSYIGEISSAVNNIINRDFHSDKPN